MSKGFLMARVLLTFLKLHVPKPIFHCTFCKKDGHTFNFCFRRVKHERRVRAKAFRKPHSLSHGTCAPSVGAKLSVDASCSKSQGTSHLMENGVPSNRPLYHCSFLRKIGIKRAIAIGVPNACGELVLLRLWLFIALLMA